MALLTGAIAAICAIAAVLAVAILVVAFAAERAMVHPRMYPISHVAARGDRADEFPPGFLERPKTCFMLRSPEGGLISVTTIAGRGDRTCLFVHGVTWTWLGMAKYMGDFIDRSWNVVALDLPGHGDSGGGPPTYGIAEREAVRLCADWALREYPGTRLFGLYGESMGAATVLQYAPQDRRVSFVIADSPYSSARKELEWRLAQMPLTRPLAWAAGPLASALVARLDGFRLEDASPETAIRRTDVPIMLFHGTGDRTVPFSMSRDMYEARKGSARTELRLVPNADHVRSILVDPEGYRKALWGFIDSVDEGR
jgi:uncharacterized protein